MIKGMINDDKWCLKVINMIICDIIDIIISE